MIFKNPYWVPRRKMQMLQRWILVHSILYYELDYSVVEDSVFDANCQQLVEMMNSPECSGENELTDYWYVFDGFMGSTAFDLPGLLNKKDKRVLTDEARRVMNRHRHRGIYDG